MKNSFFKKIFALHSILGLIAGLFVLVFSLTGSVLVFTQELDRAQFANAFELPSSTTRDYNLAIKNLERSYPEYSVFRIIEKESRANSPIWVQLKHKTEKKRKQIFLNPVNGTIKTEVKDKVSSWFLKLHHTFFLDKFGEFLAGVFAVALFFSTLTGFIIYRKHLFKALTFQVDFNFKNWRTSSSTLHRYLGVWVLIFNLTLSFTGFWLMREVFTPKFFLGEEVKKEKKASSAPFSQSSLDINTLLKNFQAQFPEVKPNLILPADNPEGKTIIKGDEPGLPLLGYYGFEAQYSADGKYISHTNEASLPFDKAFDSWVRTLHFGQYWGLAVKIVFAFCGISTGIISITGFLLWWRKKSSSKRKAAHKRTFKTPASAEPVI